MEFVPAALKVTVAVSRSKETSRAVTSIVEFGWQVVKPDVERTLEAWVSDERAVRMRDVRRGS